LFLRDVGGGEYYQIFYYNFDDATSTMLTDGTSRNGFINWSNKGNKFAFYSTKRNQKDWDIYISDMGNPTEAKLVHQEGGTWVPMDWSPNDKKTPSTEVCIHHRIVSSYPRYKIRKVDSNQSRRR